MFSLLFYLLGLFTGLVIAGLIILANKREVQARVQNFLSKPATIIEEEPSIEL